MRSITILVGMENKIYCISGLGADKSAFQCLELREFELTHIDWRVPGKSETIADYAKNMIAKFNFEASCTLVGLSFGGMVAVEISKLIPIKKLILISSMATGKELPFRFRFAGFLHLHKWLPIGLLKSANVFTYYLFGVQSREHKRYLKETLKNTDSHFLRWALGAIIRWKNESIPTMLQLHGSKDHILNQPSRREVKIIQGGGHLMIINFSKEVSALLIAEFSIAESSK